MTFTLSWLLIVYFIFLICFVFFSLINIYHLVRYGVLNFTTFLATFLYLAVTLVIIFISWQYLSQINWQQTIELFKGIKFTSPY